MFCDGGLALCKTCGGAEADLPTDCPGRGLTDDERTGIETGALDFLWKQGWVRTNLPQSPAPPRGVEVLRFRGGFLRRAMDEVMPEFQRRLLEECVLPAGHLDPRTLHLMNGSRIVFESSDGEPLTHVNCRCVYHENPPEDET
jgi:hypothetical protein